MAEELINSGNTQIGKFVAIEEGAIIGKKCFDWSSYDNSKKHTN
ncbi:hypothetical protein [Peribacillus frigoritolerans]|nr:hypothetical protein [Peribacillus frigoritolerans]MCM3166846.1 hypothetical protein [Peribacillus frigoritolerans]